MDLNLYSDKTNQPTLYEENEVSLGTSFTVSNNSNVEWDAYTFLSTPTNYEETSMRIEFPEDVNITWISSATQPSINRAYDACDNSTRGVIVIDVEEIAGTATWNGFWNIKAKSNNYMKEMTTLNNATGTWVSSNEYNSGQYLNVTAKINKSSVISDYIEQTKAKLQIRFPNGTIWTSQIQLKSPDTDGNIVFDAILIPESGVDYVIIETQTQECPGLAASTRPRSLSPQNWFNPQTTGRRRAVAVSLFVTHFPPP